MPQNIKITVFRKNEFLLTSFILKSMRSQLYCLKKCRLHSNAPIKSKIQQPPSPSFPGQISGIRLATFCARGVGNLTFVWVG